MRIFQSSTVKMFLGVFLLMMALVVAPQQAQAANTTLHISNSTGQTLVFVTEAFSEADGQWHVHGWNQAAPGNSSFTFKNTDYQHNLYIWGLAGDTEFRYIASKALRNATAYTYRPIPNTLPNNFGYVDPYGPDNVAKDLKFNLPAGKQVKWAYFGQVSFDGPTDCYWSTSN